MTSDRFHYPRNELEITYIREIRLDVIRGKLPRAEDVIAMCERLEDLEDAGDGETDSDFGRADEEEEQDFDEIIDELRVECTRLRKMLTDAGYDPGDAPESLTVDGVDPAPATSPGAT